MRLIPDDPTANTSSLKHSWCADSQAVPTTPSTKKEEMKSIFLAGNYSFLCCLLRKGQNMGGGEKMAEIYMADIIHTHISAAKHQCLCLFIVKVFHTIVNLQSYILRIGAIVNIITSTDSEKRSNTLGLFCK